MRHFLSFVFSFALFVQPLSVFAQTGTRVDLDASVSGETRLETSGASDANADMDAGAHVGTTGRIETENRSQSQGQSASGRGVLDVSNETTILADDEITVLLRPSSDASEKTESRRAADLRGTLEAQGAVYIKLGDIKGESTDDQGTSGNTVVVDGAKVRSALAADGISRVTVRGWDPEKKEAITDATVRSEADLELVVAAAALHDSRIERAIIADDEVTVDYRSRGRLFGIIPIGLLVSTAARVRAGADETSRVKVRMPWYRFLVSTDISVDSIEADIAQELNASLDRSAGVQTDLTARAYTFVAISNALKNKHETAMSSVRNMK